MVRLVIPVDTFENERSRIFEHFGRTPEFAVVDISDDGRITSLTSKRNMGEHFGGHGFEIMEEIFERTGRVWRPGSGAIYPTLSWLEEQGYIETTVEIRGEKARKPYRITKKGLEALKEYRTVKQEGLQSLEWIRAVWRDM